MDLKYYLFFPEEEDGNQNDEGGPG